MVSDSLGDMRKRGFGDLEATLMDQLWSRESPTTVREIFDDLVTDRDIAYTTVMTTLDNLHRKGWLTRKRDGKAYRYQAKMTREQYSAQLMREVYEGGGRSDLVLAHFLEQMSPEESMRLRQALRQLDTAEGAE